MVLHTLRCLGFTSMGRLGAIVVDLATVDVEDRLLALAAQGLVTHSPGQFGGWGLTDAGKAADAERIALELERAGARDHVRVAYEDLLDLNQRVLDICAAWQLRTLDGVVTLNDHTDEAYDAGVLERLADLDAEAQPVCGRLGAGLHRFSQYGPRLTTALDRAGRGDLDQVTNSVDSYHAVWFQLHEDLLATLGISRESYDKTHP